VTLCLEGDYLKDIFVAKNVIKLLTLSVLY